jgi:hypothetical protein
VSRLCKLALSLVMLFDMCQQRFVSYREMLGVQRGKEAERWSGLCGVPAWHRLIVCRWG